MISLLKVSESDADDIFEMAGELSMSFEVGGKHELSDFHRVLKDDETIFLIARIANFAVGYLYGNTHYAFYAAQNVAWIEELYVKEAYRRSRVATGLLKQAEFIANEQKAALIGVATRRAEQFYERSGYQRSAHYFRKLLRE